MILTQSPKLNIDYNIRIKEGIYKCIMDNINESLFQNELKNKIELKNNNYY